MQYMMYINKMYKIGVKTDFQCQHTTKLQVTVKLYITIRRWAASSN